MNPITFVHTDGREVTIPGGNPDQMGSRICKDLLGIERNEDGWTAIEYDVVSKKVYDAGWRAK